MSNISELKYVGFFISEKFGNSSYDSSTAHDENINSYDPSNVISLRRIYDTMERPTDILYSWGNTTASQIHSRFIVNDDLFNTPDHQMHDFAPNANLNNNDPYTIGVALRPTAIIPISPIYDKDSGKYVFNDKLSTKRSGIVAHCIMWDKILKTLSMLSNYFAGVHINSNNTNLVHSILNAINLWLLGCTVEDINNQFTNIIGEDTLIATIKSIFVVNNNIRPCPLWLASDGNSIYEAKSSLDATFGTSIYDSRMTKIGFTVILPKVTTENGNMTVTNYQESNKQKYTICAYIDPKAFINEYNYGGNSRQYKVMHVIDSPEMIYTYYTKETNLKKCIQFSVSNNAAQNMLLMKENNAKETQKMFDLVSKSVYAHHKRIGIPINGDENTLQYFEIVSKTKEIPNNLDDIYKNANLLDAIKKDISQEFDHWYNEKIIDPTNPSAQYARLNIVDGVAPDTPPSFEAAKQQDNLLTHISEDIKRQAKIALLRYRYQSIFKFDDVRYIVFLGTTNTPNIPNTDIADISATSLFTIKKIKEYISTQYNLDIDDASKTFEISTVHPYYGVFVVAGENGALTDLFPLYKPDLAITAQNSKYHAKQEGPKDQSPNRITEATVFVKILDKIYNIVTTNNAEFKNVTESSHTWETGIREMQTASVDKALNQVAFTYKQTNWIVDYSKINQIGG